MHFYKRMEISHQPYFSVYKKANIQYIKSAET